MTSRLTTRSLCVGRFARRRCRSSTVARPPRQPEKEPQALLKQGGAEWLLGPSGAPVLASNPHGSFVQWLSSSAQEAKHMVLPRGYPESAAPGYGGYTGWLAAGLFAHSFTVMVSTNALLSGFFAEMSAASWLMKDLLPPLVAGTLASRIHSLEASPHLVDLRARASPPPRRVSAHLPLRRTRRSGCRPPALRTRCSAAPSSSSRTCCPRRPGWGSPSSPTSER